MIFVTQCIASGCDFTEAYGDRDQTVDAGQYHERRSGDRGGQAHVNTLFTEDDVDRLVTAIGRFKSGLTQ